ncbi:hypothetical protein B0J14DRAFT_568354 [Halenospora varia]|nr:hypothetical protein B0J14DRAFT_568354 [Halenospora varia]
MATSTKPASKTSSQSAASAPSSSPPIPIPETKGKAKSSILSPPNSYETKPKTPQPIRGSVGHTFEGYLPPTPSDVLPEKAQRKPILRRPSDRPEDILNRLLFLESSGRSPLNYLDEDNLMKLRNWKYQSFALPFKVDRESFLQWDNLWDFGGYEYDARHEKLIVKTVPGPVHEGTVEVFTEWFGDLSRSGDLNQKGKLTLRTNQEYDLCGEYSGGTAIPDLAVHVGKEDLAIVVEVAVSQGLEELKEQAKKWLIGGEVVLVILVNIELDTANAIPYSSFSTDASNSNPPYDLDTEDFNKNHSKNNVKVISSKILEWYERQDPYCPLAHMSKATVYLYRHQGYHTEPDEKIVFFEEGEYKDCKVQLFPQDFGLSHDSTVKEINLPLGILAERFPTIVEQHSQKIAFKRAIKLLLEHKRQDRHDGTYEDTSPSFPSVAVPSSSQASPKPPKRSSTRVKRTAADSESVAKSQKRRKGDTAQMPDIGKSFETTSSGVMFPYDSTEGETDQAFSNPTSFVGESATVMHAPTSFKPPGGKTQKRRSKMGKKG